MLIQIYTCILWSALDSQWLTLCLGRMRESQRWRRKKAITWIGARTGQCWQTKSWASWYCVVNIHYVIWFYVISTCFTKIIPKMVSRVLPTINWYVQAAWLNKFCSWMRLAWWLHHVWIFHRFGVFVGYSERCTACWISKLVSASVKVVPPRISDRECPDQKAEVGDWLTGFWCLELQKAKQIVMIARCFTKWRIASVW